VFASANELHNILERISAPDFKAAPPRYDGFSGGRLIALLQELAVFQQESGCYAEVGVYRGLTLTSVAAVTSARVFGIDNYAEHDPDGQNRGIVSERLTEMGLDNAVLIDADYEDALFDEKVFGGEPISLYFVDGPHDYRSQLICLLAALPHLSDNALIVVDDANYRHVRLATNDFLQLNSDFRLVFEAYTPCHPQNMTPAQTVDARQGWWDGCHVLVRGHARHFEEVSAPIERSRMLCENEHLVQSMRHGYLAPELTRLVSELSGGRIVGAGKSFVNGIRRWRGVGGDWRGRYPTLNTWSDPLAPTRISALLNPAD
jgi:hypothetical protein